jgi:hypothetical protein
MLIFSLRIVAQRAFDEQIAFAAALRVEAS